MIPRRAHLTGERFDLLQKEIIIPSIMVEEAKESYSFIKAVEDKYTATFDAKLFNNILLSPKRRAALVNQQGNLQRTVLAVDGCNISSAGGAGEISKICPNVVELDISNNLLHSWEQVFLVLCQLPKLTFLNLSCNPLESEFDEKKLDGIISNNGIPKLKNIVLNNTNLPLKLVFKILDIFPSIEELHLSLNSYGCVVDWPSSFPNVKKLHFNNNGIEEWNDVVRIGKIFPNLKSLILCENCIKEVKVDTKAIMFEKLATLSLSQTEVDDWNSLDEMRKLPVLEDLRLVGIPLVRREESSKARQLVISRLPNVKKLNGSSIDSNEREDAERFFLRYYMDSDDPPARYHELVGIHGEVSRLAEVDMSVKEHVQVTVYLNEEEHSKLVIDLSNTIREFRRIIGRKLCLAPKSFRMFHVDEYIPTELSPLSKHLNSCYIKDGDRILVQSFNK